MNNKLIKTNLLLAVVLMVYVPFHAFISIYLSSIFGHYTITRLIEEFILIIMLVIGVYLFFSNFSISKKMINTKLVILILFFLLLQLIWALIFYLHKDINIKATFYGLLINTRYLIFFLLVYQAVGLVKELKIKIKLNINKVILIPALIVVMFGIAEVFILPRDFLKHFGYGPDTIMPYETINHNLNYIRIMSTTRGANPLGAYLIIPSVMLFLSLIKNKLKLTKETIFNIIFLALTLLTIYYSYSRSALVGVLLSFALTFYLSVRNSELRKKITILISIAVLILVSSFIVLRNNTHFQNVVFHTQSKSSIKTTSDQGHASALASGIRDIAKNPLGNGPGSSGQASVYNSHPARISENYFLQIGQETGIIGLALFIGIIFLIIKKLYLNRSEELNLILLASTAGILVVCSLSLALSDETLSFILFGLLGFSYLSNRELKNARK